MHVFSLLVLTKPWLVHWAERILRESCASKIMLLPQRPWRSVKEVVSLKAKDETTRWRRTRWSALCRRMSPMRVTGRGMEMTLNASDPQPEIEPVGYFIVWADIEKADKQQKK